MEQDPRDDLGSEDGDRSAELPAAWNDTERAQHYAEKRFDRPRRAGRDLRLVQGALERLGFSLEGHRVLDAPSGTGRLHPLLSGGR